MWLLFVLVDVGGLAVGAWRLWRARGRRELVELLRFGVVLAAVASAAAVLLTGSLFGIVRILCHVLFCVMAPLAIACGVGQLRARRFVAAVLLIAAGLGAEAAYLYAKRVEPFDLQIRRYAITTSRIRKPIKILVLADLQTDRVGEFERHVFRRMDAERADLILLPGDYLHIGDREAYMRERPRLVALFSLLKHKPPLGIYAVVGDTEPSADVLDGSGAVMLVDELVKLDNARAQVIGLDLGTSRRPAKQALLDQVRGFDGLSIVLAHRPAFMGPLIEDGSDTPFLAICGHTHGGQIVLPGIGPIVTASVLPRRYAGGLHEIGKAWLMVSRGVGMERGYAPRIRLFCPPELVVIDVRPR